MQDVEQEEARDGGSGSPLQATAAGCGADEGGESSPTVCTNCQTTNTPLWRRDPEGQPLCTSSSSLSPREM